MNPDIEKAVPYFREQGILAPENAARILRIARGELVSIYPEIRLLYYAGVLLVASGAGILITENYQNLGPLTVALALGIGAIASLIAAARMAAPFSWEETPSPSAGFDFLLLLGVLLASADIGFIEYQFTPLGANWPWHLLFVFLFMLIVAVRYDSRMVFSLALSTFAAWRGVSVSLIERPLWSISAESLRWNAVGCGILFVVIAFYMVRSRHKAHFEMVALAMGWLLILGAFVSGCLEEGIWMLAYISLLALTGAGLSWHSFVRKRFLLFIFGVLGVYIALAALVLKSMLPFQVKLVWIAATSLLLIGILWRVQKRMKEPL